MLVSARMEDDTLGYLSVSLGNGEKRDMKVSIYLQSPRYPVLKWKYGVAHASPQRTKVVYHLRHVDSFLGTSTSNNLNS